MNKRPFSKNRHLPSRLMGWTVVGFFLCLQTLQAGTPGDDKHSSRLTDEKIPLQVDAVPKRPKPILELGEPFLGTGTLSPGFLLPTGAVWQPNLLVFGVFRSAVQSHPGRDGEQRLQEWANRLDLFSNLQLSGSERIVLGFRNLDSDGQFSGYIFDSDQPANEEGSVDAFDADVESLFFEGDFGEIFPGLSKKDFSATDIGFAIGRQPLFFQEGMLINDAVDGIGLTRNSLLPAKTSNLRLTFFWGWDHLTPQIGERDSGRLLALLTSIDTKPATLDFDIAHVIEEDGFEDLTVAGFSTVYRRGAFNTSLRLLGSFSDASSRDGALAFGEFSWTPKRTHNLAYFNIFAIEDNFTAAAIGPGNGPLARVGINFAGVGLGNYGAPLSGETSDVGGGTFGYQMFFNNNRRQLLFEFGTRLGLADEIGDAYAFTARYQMAMGRRVVLVFDGFLNNLEENDGTAGGGRFELLVKF